MTVRVTGADSGDPLPGAIVLLVSSANPFDRRYALRVRDRPGHMRLGPLHSGSYRLTVMPGSANPGYAAIEGSTGPDGAPGGTIDIRPEDDVALDVSLPRVAGSPTAQDVADQDPDAGGRRGRSGRRVLERGPTRPGPGDHGRAAGGVARPGPGLPRPHRAGGSAVVSARAAQRTRTWLMGAALGLLLVPGATATASGADPIGTLTGTVTGDGAPVASALVTLTPWIASDQPPGGPSGRSPTAGDAMPSRTSPRAG